MLVEFKKKNNSEILCLIKKVLKVNVMTVGVHKAGPDRGCRARDQVTAGRGNAPK